MNSILSYFMPSSSAKESEVDKKASVTITGEVVLSKSVKFYKYSAKTCEFELYSADKKEFQIGLVKEKKFTYSLFVKDGSNPVLLQPFDYTMSPVFRRDFLSFIWNYPASSQGDSQPSSSGTITLSCVFSKKEDEEEFRVAFMKAYFETTCQTEYTEAEGGYINDVYMEPMESEESDEDAAEVETEESESEVEEVSTPSKITSGTRGASRSGTSHTPQKIKGMSLTYTPNTNKSFVLRGDDIGVFDTLSGQFNTSLSIKGTPSKLMMYDQDTSLILNDVNNFSKLNKYDVETQKIVNEWHIEKDGVELEAGHMFTPSKKYGQMTSEQVFLSGGKNLLMTLDPRMSNPVANYNMYKTNPAFSSMTTTEDGNIAVVGKDGDLRLYDKVDKRAKTFMKGLGGTPIGVDVSNDGKWCLVTFDCYLLLVECVRDGMIYAFLVSNDYRCFWIY